MSGENEGIREEARVESPISFVKALEASLTEASSGFNTRGERISPSELRKRESATVDALETIKDEWKSIIALNGTMHGLRIVVGFLNDSLYSATPEERPVLVSIIVRSPIELNPQQPQK